MPLDGPVWYQPSPTDRGAEERDPTLLSPFYTDDAEFDGSARRSVAQLRLLIDWGPERSYFTEQTKSLFISDNPEEKEAARRKSKWAGLNLNCVDGGR